jgi:hypothetical protein
MGDRRGTYRVYWGDLREGYHSENLGVHGRIIIKWILKTWDGVMNWIYLAQDRDRWRACMNPLMKLRVP